MFIQTTDRNAYDNLLWLVIHSCWPAVIGYTQLLACCDWSYRAFDHLLITFWPRPPTWSILKFLTFESDRVSGYSSISVGGISAVLQPCRPNLSSTDWWYSSLCDNNTCLSLLNCQHKPQLREQWKELQSCRSATQLQSDTGQRGISTGIGE